jgi:GNAT superfamily N-acetyltransferase
MADMLVKLYDLPDPAPLLAALDARGVSVRRAAPLERARVVDWVGRHFHEGWARECEASFGERPVACFVAVGGERPGGSAADPHGPPPEAVLGFACYHAAARGMFGPEGVHADHRGRGVGRALLAACLDAMRAEGFAYAVIGWAGPQAFYARTVGATVIEGSEPGVYRGPMTGLGGRRGPGRDAP